MLCSRRVKLLKSSDYSKLLEGLSYAGHAIARGGVGHVGREDRARQGLMGEGSVLTWASYK